MKRITLFISLSAFLGLGLFSCQHPASLTLNEKIADAYGLSNFKKIKSIAYTFNIKKDTFTFSRSWKWFPQTHEVYFISHGDTLHYMRDTISSGTIKNIDEKFINDKYWMLFPFQLVWDKGCTMTTKYGQHAPIGGDTTTCLTVAYKDSAGYTPHDSYDLYLDSLYMIREWAYHKGSVDTPSLVTTWGDVQDFDGIRIATTHFSRDSSFKLWFSGIKVEE